MDKDITLKIDTSGAVAGLSVFTTTVQNVMNKLTAIITDAFGKVKVAVKVFKLDSIIAGIKESISAALQGLQDSEMAGKLSSVAQQFSEKIMSLKAVIETVLVPFVGALMLAGSSILGFFISITSLIASAASQMLGFTDNTAKSTTKAVAGQNALAKATISAGKAANTAMVSFDELNLLQRGGSGGGSTAKPTMSSKPDEGGYNELAGLQKALKPLGKALWVGLEWGYNNILKPLGNWTANSAVPEFMKLLSAALGALAAVLAPLQPLGTWLWEGLLQPLASWSGDIIINAIEGIAGALSVLAGWLEGNRGAFDGFVSGIMPLLEGLSGALMAVLDGIGQAFALWWGSLGDTMSGSLAMMTGLLTGNWEQAWQGVSLIFEAATALLLDQLAVLSGGLFEGFVTLWAGLQELLLAVWEGVSLNVITPLADKFGWLFDFIFTVADVGVNALMGIFGPLVGWIGSRVVMPIAELMKWLWNDIADSARLGLELVVGWVGDYISNTLAMAAVGLNFFIGLINKLIDGLNSIQISIPRWVPKYGGESFGISIPHIPTVAVPKLATGAVIPANREFLALMGDQRNGRNLEAPESLIRQIVREESGAGQDARPLSVELLLDGDVIYQAMLEREERRGLRVGGAFANAY